MAAAPWLADRLLPIAPVGSSMPCLRRTRYCIHWHCTLPRTPMCTASPWLPIPGRTWSASRSRQYLLGWRSLKTIHWRRRHPEFLARGAKEGLQPGQPGCSHITACVAHNPQPCAPQKSEGTLWTISGARWHRFVRPTRTARTECMPRSPRSKLLLNLQALSRSHQLIIKTTQQEEESICQLPSSSNGSNTTLRHLDQEWPWITPPIPVAARQPLQDDQQRYHRITIRT